MNCLQLNFKVIFYFDTLITISKVYNQQNIYCWIILRAFPFSCYTLLYIITVLLDTTQTTPGPSENMDYITNRCRATTCHECTVSNKKYNTIYYAPRFSTE